jgi:protein MpaA
LLFATIHGDEPAGTELLQRLRVFLQDQPDLLERWQVRLILRLNRDSQRRTNLRGVDLNRNFPSFWQRSSGGAEYSGPRPLSEPESQALQRAVLGQWPAPFGRPERILSFHQHRGIPSGSAWLDADGPATDIVKSMQAQAQGRLSIHKVADSRGRLRIPGSFGTWAQQLNIPTVTFELSSQDMDGQANWDSYHQAILEFLRCP